MCGGGGELEDTFSKDGKRNLQNATGQLVRLSVHRIAAHLSCVERPLHLGVFLHHVFLQLCLYRSQANGKGAGTATVGFNQ